MYSIPGEIMSWRIHSARDNARDLDRYLRPEAGAMERQSIILENLRNRIVCDLCEAFDTWE